MSFNFILQKANKNFAKKNVKDGFICLQDAWINYPKNPRLKNEFDKIIRKYKYPIKETISSNEINKFFQQATEKNMKYVISILLNLFNKKQNDILLISLIGNFYGLDKDFKNAEKFQIMAIEKAPFEVSFYQNLSQTLEQLNKIHEAISILIIAKILAFNNKLIEYKLGKLYEKIKKFSIANQFYKNLLKEKSFSPDIYYRYGYTLIDMGSPNAAISFFETIQKKEKNNEIINTYIGVANYELKNYEKAQEIFFKVVSNNPNNYNAYSYLGKCYQKTDFFDRAKDFYLKSLLIKPNNKMALNNLASLYEIQGDIKKAEILYKTSIENHINNYEALLELSVCQLKQLNYKDGWKNYKYRWYVKHNYEKYRTYNFRKLTVSDKKITSVLVWGEQGLGDQILFLRFLFDLSLIAKIIYIDVDKRLEPIITRSFPQIKFYDKEKINFKYSVDYHIPIGDLPGFFIKDNNDLKKQSQKYILSDPEQKYKLKTNFDSKNQLICGISWKSINDNIGKNKSLTLEDLKPILSIPNITFIDLQYTDTKIERAELYSKYGLTINKISFIDNLNDLNGLSSLIDFCDFVVTISNSNAHISGALDKDTFLMLPKGKGNIWYWKSEKQKSIWYPSIQIIEQEVAGSWDRTVKDLRSILKGKISE